MKGIHRESPRCAPGTLLIQCRLHKTKKHGHSRGPGHRRPERERERESFIRNNLHNGVVSGAARGQALLADSESDSDSESKTVTAVSLGERERPSLSP